MRDRSKQLLVINTGKKEPEQTRLPAQSGTTHIIGGGGLSVNMADYLLKSIWDKVFEIRTDSQGIEYIFGKLPVVTQYGITMFSGDGVNVPSLASGLPFDGRTIWYNPDTQQIEVIGGTGGGSGEGVSNFWDLSGIPSWITNSKPKYTYTEIEGTPDLSGYATESWVLGKSYITSATLGTELGKYVTLDTDQPLKGKKDFKNGLSIDGLELRKSQDDVVYIDANLVVRGGVTMYAQNEVNIPPIIDSIPTASTTVKGIASFDGAYFSVVNGKVSLIASNVGLNEEELYNYLTSNNYAKKSDIPSLVGYATQSWVENKKYLTAISSAMVTSALGFTPFNSATFTKANIKSTLGISDWALASSKPSYTTSEVSEGTNLYFTNARAVSALTETLKAYVTLSGSQTITGEKNFVGGLKVNGSPIYYDTEKKYWKLEGDLLVTGGVTMYGSDSSFTPSTIMDALLYDDTTLGINSNGQLYVKGGTSGGGLDITALQNYLTQNSYLNVTSADNRYLMLSGGRIVGKLQIQRTPSNIAFYNADNVLWGHIGFNAANNAVVWDRSGANEYEILHRGNYSSYALPLSGGTITGELHVSSTSTNRAIIRLLSAADVPNDLLFGTNGEYHWSITSRNIEEGRYIGLYNNKEGSNGWVFKANYDTRVLDFMNTPTVNGNTIWHSDNDGSGSGLDADLLDGKHLSEIIRYEGYSNKNANKADTPQTITYWAENGGYGSTYGTALNIQGASSWNNRIAFRTDGKIDYYQGINTGDMSYIGQLAFTSSNVASATKLQTARTIWGQSFDGTGNVSGVISNLSTIIFDTSLGATNIGYLWTNTRGMHMDMSGLGTEQQGTNLTLTPSGNVGIGTPNPSAKFQVNGNASIHSSSAGVISLYRTTSDGGSYVDYYPMNQTSNKWRVGAGSVDEFFYEAPDGSNLARICHNATRGTRLEVGRRFLSVQPSGSDADRSVITLISNGDAPTDFIMGSGNYAWSITSRNSAEGHLLGFYSALSGQYAMRVYKEGNVLVTGGITMYSDQRKKTILNHVELSLKDIANAPLIEHYYNVDDKKTTHVGSIAQYWASMNDWFCKLDSEGFYTMEIQNAALASAISIARELDRYETKTDKAIKKLKKRICELEEEVERLKSA